MRLRLYLILLLALAPACAHRLAPAPPPPPPRPITLSIVGTSDLHGHIESLPWLGGHLANLRAARAADGGGVLLVDAGDMFQGTLESNLGEGAAVVRGYNTLGYTAAAIGNHEFDFGPAGPAHVPASANDDPRGALKARAAAARFPFLAANVATTDGRALDWPNVRPAALVEVAGVRVGLVGVTTIGTPHATHPRNFAGLAVAPLAATIAARASELRAQGASAIVVLAHAGGECKRFDAPDDLSSCLPGQEIFAVASALPPGLVDVIAAGHTHQGVAHRVAGIAIVPPFAEGRAFGRVDLTIEGGRVTASRIFPPRFVCDAAARRGPKSFAATACQPEAYEARPVRFDAGVAAALSADVAVAAARRAQPLGVTITAPVSRSVSVESALGNLFVDLMRLARPQVDAAVVNGGSLRADIPAGPLTYGRLYEALPFDDGLAVLRISAGELAAVVARNLGGARGILSLSGLRATARCTPAGLAVDLHRPNGAPVPAATPLAVLTNGYLGSGGDGLFDPRKAEQEDGPPVRDVLAEVLTRRGGTLAGDDPALLDAHAPRVAYPGERPVRCAGSASER
jgi:2',3'-cyclic-nucleotide 2'-phosphodiesterase (5'-nucleotidase family)